ncbi:MAG: hypothetical protein JNM88_00655 [Chitinophagaceae bacterium]|nr:hypothetical protein [Chitinophagaceae bacterium]
MLTLNFTLRQHSPLIHFQPDMGGATLRATELKPKLDNYVISMMGGIDVVSKNYSNWLIPGQKSFDYKIKISATPSRHEVIMPGVDNQPPFFFGNIGDEYKRNPNKYLNFSDTPIKVSIRTFNNHIVSNESLLDFIRSVLPSFFLSVNFGTRQSKGYGSFYLHEKDPLYEDPEDRIAFQNDGNGDFLPYSITLRTNGRDTFERSIDALKRLEVFYKAMRSGINRCYGRNQHYLKSLLWLYFKRIVDNNIKWEKKKIKEQLLGRQPETLRQTAVHSGKPGYEESPLGSGGSHELLIKDMFGLASEETWDAKYDRFKIEKIIEDVDRFKSPIFFKLLMRGDHFKIFFHAHELTTENSVIGRMVEINKTLRIRTPSVFDFHSFFDYLSNADAFNLDNHFIVHTNNEETNSSDYQTVSAMKKSGRREFERIDNYKILKGIISELQSH